MVTTSTSDRFYEIYGKDTDYVPNDPTCNLEVWRLALAAKKIYIASGSIFIAADSTGGADTKGYMWIMDSVDSEGAPVNGTWVEL